MNEKNTSFESNMQRLEQIVRDMERGDVALEESLKLFQEGTELVRACGKLLDEAAMAEGYQGGYYHGRQSSGFTTVDLSKMDGVEAGDKIDFYFWNSLTGMQQLIEVVDGGFIPKFKATYYIHYSVTDKTGNTNEIVIPIEISDNTEKICIENISDADQNPIVQ